MNNFHLLFIYTILNIKFLINNILYSIDDFAYFLQEYNSSLIEATFI
jgi:hypothetical protein